MHVIQACGAQPAVWWSEGYSQPAVYPKGSCESAVTKFDVIPAISFGGLTPRPGSLAKAEEESIPLRARCSMNLA